MAIAVSPGFNIPLATRLEGLQIHSRANRPGRLKIFGFFLHSRTRACLLEELAPIGYDGVVGDTDVANAAAVRGYKAGAVAARWERVGGGGAASTCIR